MTLGQFNALPEKEARSELLRCCGSRRWALEMAARRPYGNLDEMIEAAEKFWNSLSPSDWREAFAQHPRIGDIKNLRKTFPSTAQWAEREQAGLAQTSEEVLKELAEGNRLYEAKFGYFFIVCATAKSAEEMLALMKTRLNNVPADELKVAVGEQTKITRLRLEKFFSE